MKKKFKMVVVSLSFLIIGGILVACGNSKKTTKVTTTEATTEAVVEEGTEIACDGYKILLPDGYKLLSTEDGTTTYQKSENELFIIVTEVISDNEIDEINETYIKSLMEKSYLTDSGVEKSFEYKEGFGYKAATYSVEYNVEGKKMLIHHFTSFDSVNKKMLMMSFVMEDYKSNKEAEELTKTANNAFDNFIKTNFGSQ